MGYYLKDTSPPFPDTIVNRWTGQPGRQWWQGAYTSLIYYHAGEPVSQVGVGVYSPPSNPVAYVGAPILPRDYLTDLNRLQQIPFPAPQPSANYAERGFGTYIGAKFTDTGAPYLEDELGVDFGGLEGRAVKQLYRCAQTVYNIRRYNSSAFLGESGWDYYFVEMHKTKARVFGAPGQTYCLFDTDEADLDPNAITTEYGRAILGPRRNCRTVVAGSDGWLEIDTPATVNTRTWFDEGCDCQNLAP